MTSCKPVWETHLVSPVSACNNGGQRFCIGGGGGEGVHSGLPGSQGLIYAKVTFAT